MVRPNKQTKKKKHSFIPPKCVRSWYTRLSLRVFRRRLKLFFATDLQGIRADLVIILL